MRGWSLVAVLVLASSLVLLGLRWRSGDDATLPGGDQEIAWIHAATSGLIWDQFVRGVQRFEASEEGRRLGLSASYERANLEQTTAIPEIVLSRRGCPQRLHLRWYKLTSGTDADAWVRVFRARKQPPLAIIGGSSSDRARDLALALRRGWDHAEAPPPVLCITTATADRVWVPEGPGSGGDVPLHSLYAGRTFRFCFTNSQMADALVRFLLDRPDLALPVPERLLAGMLGQTIAGQPLAAAAAGLASAVRPVLSLAWEDDPYSLDLAEHLRHFLTRRTGWPVEEYRIAYSTGEVLRSNRPESEALRAIAAAADRRLPNPPAILLPIGERPLRRVLRSLAAMDPRSACEAVVLTGDTLSLDVVYRDRGVLWPLPELPFSLIFFAHEDPVGWPEQTSRGDTDGNNPSATHDLLLNVRIIRLTTQAAWREAPTGHLTLVRSADEFLDGLRQNQPALFDGDGNRLGTSGVYLICLRPHRPEAGMGKATIQVWLGRPDGSSAVQTQPWQWQLVKQLHVAYGG
jgi:hypothetical protein